MAKSAAPKETQAPAPATTDTPAATQEETVTTTPAETLVETVTEPENVPAVNLEGVKSGTEVVLSNGTVVTHY